MTHAADNPLVAVYTGPAIMRLLVCLLKGMQMRILISLLARFSEPSSYVGLGAMLAVLGWNLPETVIGQLIQGLGAASASLALVLKDRGLLVHRGADNPA
jgi:hypothetical protein